MRVALLTISDAGARGERADTSGDAVIAWADSRGDTIADRSIVADETDAIVAALRRWCDGDLADLVLTTGGTGLALRDVTPEATRAVIDREAPGIAERLRMAGSESTPLAVLSRGVAGTRGRTLIVNLPGAPSGVRDSLAALDPFIDHAVRVLRGEITEHPAPGR